MVKSWIPSRLKRNKEAPSSGESRVGTRALTSTFGRNLLSALRRALVRRRKPLAITATQVLDEVLPAVVVPITSTLPSSVRQPTAPKPPPGFDSEDSDESDNEDEEDEGDEGHVATTKPKKKKRASKKGSVGINRWVPKLLNPVEKHRDRVYRKKKKPIAPTTQGPPILFTDPRTLHKVLLARVFAFLDPLEPARVTTYVNKTTVAAVRAYYELYCPPPRPRRYLVNRILESHQSLFPTKLMELLPFSDRVRASGSCRSFYNASNALPLEFDGSHTPKKFLTCGGFPQTGRFHKRYGKTQVISFSEVCAEEVAKFIELLVLGSDDDDYEDDTDCFASVREISLRSVRGFSASNGKYFEQILQVLFMDNVNFRLHTLELVDLKLDDLLFKQLVRLWKDARFPALRRLSLAQNAFSSRFVRDWSRCFKDEKFSKLEAIDVSDTEMTNEDLQRFIACLSSISALKRLALSNNFCSFATIHKLRELVEAKALSALVELNCEAVATDMAAIGHLAEAFHSVPGCCPHLKVMNVSGNPLSDPKAATQLARNFASMPQLSSAWSELVTLNLSSMQLGDDGFRTISTAMLHSPPTRIQQLDLSNNCIGSSIDVFARTLKAGKLKYLRSLALADNNLGALEFEALSSALSSGCCLRLDELDLSANIGRGEGIARFCSFLLSPPSRNLWALDLSQNDIPHRGILRLNETLQRGNCINLHELNLSRNPSLQAIVSFLDLIRGDGLPSLTVLQLGHAQSRSEGHDLVQETIRRRSVQELRRIKQQRFEERMTAKEIEGDARAANDQIRCLKQSQRLREVYDHLENEADRALHRRKKHKKPTQLHIHQEITRQKQQRAHSQLLKHQSQAA